VILKSGLGGDTPSADPGAALGLGKAGRRVVGGGGIGLGNRPLRNVFSLIFSQQMV